VDFGCFSIDSAFAMVGNCCGATDSDRPAPKPSLGVQLQNRGAVFVEEESQKSKRPVVDRPPRPAVTEQPREANPPDNTESISAIVEVQRLIATGEIDVDGTMHLIADRARNVANATGVAIGLLKRDELVYWAGSGSAATHIGRRVMAILSVSAHKGASDEILRVENTQTDARIEAAICRQLGAKSLLIVPIYYARAVAGVLEVRFNEAHAFQDREVRIYRSMAGLVGEAMSHAARLGQKQALTAERSNMRHAIEQMTPQMQKVGNASGSVQGRANKHGVYQACGATAAEARKLLAGAAALIALRAKRIPLRNHRWKAAMAAVVAVLGVASWIAYREHRPGSRPWPSAVPISNAIEPQEPIIPSKLVPANSAVTPRTAPQRIRVGNSQVRYIGEDVTVRYFTVKPALQRMRVMDNRVEYIGEDVTVRYLMSKSAPVLPARSVDAK
jgi:putative methionine-R-sulfoxide reductase with GAF domain